MAKLGLGAATRPRTHLSTGRESGAWIPARISRTFSFHPWRDSLFPPEPRACLAATSRTLQRREARWEVRVQAFFSAKPAMSYNNYSVPAASPVLDN